MWCRNEQELLSPEPRTARTSELNGSGGGEREGDKGAKEFCRGWRHQPEQKGGLLSRLVAPTGIPFNPVGGSNRDKRLRGPSVPVGASNRDKRPLSPRWPG